MWSRRVFLPLMVAVICAWGSAWAEPERITIGNAGNIHLLHENWEVLWDPSKELTLEDVSGPGYRDAFSAPRWKGSAGYRDSSLWLRFPLVRPEQVEGPWILVLGVPFLTEVDVYGPVAGGHVALGSSVPLVDRPMRSAELAAPLTLEPGERAVVYIRVASHGALNLRGEVRPLKDALGRFETQTLMEGAVLGALLLAVFINFAVGLWLRDSLVLIYATYLASLFSLFLGVTGLVSLVFPTLGGIWPSVLCGLGSLLGVPTGLMLWARLLRLRETLPFLWGLYAGVSLGALGALVTLGSSWYGKVAPLFFMAAVVMGFVSLGVAVWRAWRGRDLEVSGYFVAGLGILLLSAMVVTLANAGVLIPANAWTSNSYLIGAVLHAVFVNVGLAGRLRGIAKARGEAEQRAVFETRRGEEQRQFIAMLVHEFRSPLASMGRAAELIERKGELKDPGSRERMGRIRGMTERLAVLVDSFLASEALEHGGLSLDRREEALRPMLRDLASTLEEGEGRGRLTLAVDPPDLRWDLDREMATTAIGNVIANALKYSGTGPVVVEAFLDSRSMLRVTVTDQGPGLSREDRERMGDLYYRGSASTGTRGTGLGLTITHKVLAAHGGELSYVPGPGNRGTRAILIFPPAPSEEELFL